MRNKRFSVEQMIAVLKQAQVGCCCGGGDPQGRDQRTDFLSMEGYRRQPPNRMDGLHRASHSGKRILHGGNARQAESRAVFGVTFISNDQTPEVLQPGKQPLDFPPSSVSFQPTSILSRIPSVPAMWSNKFNSVEPQFCV
jgi:hypothetical protein